MINNYIMFWGENMTLEPAVKKESIYISTVSAILSALLQAGFLIASKWNYTVLLGTALGFTASVLNFFLMAITVQKAVKKEDPKERQNLIKLSHILRTFLLIAFAIIGLLIPIFNKWAFIIPLFFPRIAIYLQPLIQKNTVD